MIIHIIGYVKNIVRLRCRPSCAGEAKGQHNRPGNSSKVMLSSCFPFLYDLLRAEKIRRFFANSRRYWVYMLS